MDCVVLGDKRILVLNWANIVSVQTYHDGSSWCLSIISKIKGGDNDDSEHDPVFEDEKFMDDFVAQVKKRTQMADYDKYHMIAMEDKLKVMAQMIDDLRSQITK